MNIQLKNLIENSGALSKTQKEKYLKMLKTLSKEQKEQLFIILNKEKTKTENLEKSTNQEKSELNKTFIKDINNQYKVEHKAAVCAEEEIDKSKADKLLKDL